MHDCYYSFLINFAPNGNPESVRLNKKLSGTKSPPPKKKKLPTKLKFDEKVKMFRNMKKEVHNFLFHFQIFYGL